MSKIRFFVFCYFLISNQLFAKSYPNIEGKYWFKLQLDKDISYKDNDDNTIDNSMKYSNYFLEYSPKFKLNLNSRSSIINKWSLQSLKSPDNDKKNSFFNDEGIILNELYYHYEKDDLALSVGKYEPDFALAYDEYFNSGIWGSDYADEYRVQNKLGIRLNAKINLDDYGNHIISLNSFYNDDTELSQTMLTRRRLVVQDVGKAGSAKSLSSYILAIRGKDIYNMPNFFYNIAYRNIDAGNTALPISDESGYAISLGNSQEFFNALNLFTFVEYSKINNFNSTNDRFGPEFFALNLPGNYKYLTLMLAVKYQNWSINFNKLTKDIAIAGLNKAQQDEISLTYAIKDNLAVSIGRKYEKDNNLTKKSSFGLMLFNSKSF